MTIRAATPADRARWDDYVAQHPLGSPYHRFAWKEAMEQGYGITTGYRLSESANGLINGILPTARVPRPLGAGAWCSLPYCDRGEPLADEPAITDRLLAHLLPAAGTGSAVTCEVRATASVDDQPEAQPKAQPSHLTPGQKVRMLLALPDTAEALLAGFKSKHRSQINKAKKNGLTVSLGNTPDYVEKFYTVYSANMRDLGSPPHSLGWFLAVANAYQDDCVIALVTHNSTVIGAGLVLASPAVAAIPWASTRRNYNHLAPNMLLYWALLSHCTERGCRRFDFGRSGYEEGTYRFKAQWGAKAVPLAWRKHVAPADRGHNAISTGTGTGTGTGNDTGSPQSPAATHPPASRLRPLAEATWRRLPLPLTVAVGGRLRKYISL